ncbi:hypothetical protein SAMN05443999_10644 [Roseovarius azorensis]|uniref:Flagellar protein FliL n=1 Tax=Roseovarius azorensis TaxID=1287727 RepID=A0A1H7R3G3_9RHOB|nr:flagellar basal body-associated FliL family protein [Roseovarius azorensis]SEL54464.1 hypothetical protein SAMN05443999_10644 [Roseovarius azorensis]
MMRKLLPVLLMLAGTAGGVGVGLMLKPEPIRQTDPGSDGVAEPVAVAGGQGARGNDASAEALEYVRLNNQFVIPVVSRNLVSAMIVMSLTVEISPGTSEAVYNREPKLRDAFLQVLFDHANMGGFEGEFTSADNMDVLRRALADVAQRVVGRTARGVLITEIARQDV